MKIALCVIATGKYTRFLCELLTTAKEFFCAGHEVRVFVFTDQADEQEDRTYGAYRTPIGPISPIFPEARLMPIPHEPWPGPTLHRYRTMLTAAEDLARSDYVFYCDVDMLFTAPIADEILGPGLTAALHPGFADKPRSHWTYEYRPQSRALVRSHEGQHYFCGGFQGGKVHDYLCAVGWMSAAIDADSANGITAVWHDESHWNRYLIDHPPATVLSPLYCSPQSWRTPGRKIVALDKNHAEVR